MTETRSASALLDGGSIYLHRNKRDPYSRLGAGMWFEILVSMLGPAGLGALVGGLTGASGAIIAGTITSVSATRRERYARLFTEQKLVYSEYSAVVRHLQSRLIHGDENVGSGPTSDQIRDLEILASKRVRKAHDTTMEALNHMLKGLFRI